MLTAPTLKSTKPKVGVPIEAVPGTFTNAAKIRRNWGPLSHYGAGLKDIAGANGLSYIPTGEDVGYTLWFTEAAENPAGNVVGYTARTEVVVP